MKYLKHNISIGKNIFDNSSSVVYISDSYKSNTLKYKPFREVINKSLNIKSIPVGINSFWLKNIQKNNKFLCNNEIKILQVGDINKNKNLITSIKAVNSLALKGYNIKFLFAGEIKSKKVFKKIMGYKISKYLGFLNKKELLEAYRNADIFLMPSLHETFGLVYAEALTQKLPVIFTKNEGFDYQISNEKVAYPVEPKKVDNIASTIEKIINNYDDIQNNFQIEYERFDWKIISTAYEKIYRDVIKY